MFFLTASVLQVQDVGKYFCIYFWHLNYFKGTLENCVGSTDSYSYMIHIKCFYLYFFEVLFLKTVLHSIWQWKYTLNQIWCCQPFFKYFRKLKQLRNVNQINVDTKSFLLTKIMRSNTLLVFLAVRCPLCEVSDKPGKFVSVPYVSKQKFWNKAGPIPTFFSHEIWRWPWPCPLLSLCPLMFNNSLSVPNLLITSS